ncbi:hypothetical protein [Aliikangiella maris]|uniref:Uncharacterized protein n=1 Tax=Aliikangiella maris TaxID=3162458 RepID=A0ABV3MVA4_9GAMM
MQLYSEYTTGAIGGNSPGPIVVSSAQRGVNQVQLLRASGPKKVIRFKDGELFGHTKK